MVGQAQVIIGAEVDDRALRDADAASLRPQQDPLGLIQSCRPDLRKLLLDERFDLVVGHLWLKDDLTALPFRHQVEPFSELVQGQDVGDDGLDVETRLEESRETVPGLEEPPPGHAVHPDALEDDLVRHVKETCASGMPNSVTRPPFLTYRKHLWMALGLPDISSATSTPSPPVMREIWPVSSPVGLIV